MTPLLPVVVGHRGAAAHAPENTLAGIRAAAAMGIGAVEVDVKLTGDGELILFHDERVERTTNGTGAVCGTGAVRSTGAVCDMTLAQLQALDAGSWFGTEFAGETIPTLAQAIAEILALGLQVNLEIKPCPGREAETARVTVAAVRALWPDDRPLPLLSSFAMAALETARHDAPEQPRAILVKTGTPQQWCATAKHHGAVAVHGKASCWTPAHADAVKAAGLACGCFTVNQPEQALILRAMGVDYFFSDDPATIAEALSAG
ncbi:MAG: glycerophosphodiester phosphodiesterase family protein [Alphaproteobacteria bacterium]